MNVADIRIYPHPLFHFVQPKSDTNGETVKDWNTLPQNVVDVERFNGFKRQVD